MPIVGCLILPSVLFLYLQYSLLHIASGTPCLVFLLLPYLPSSTVSFSFTISSSSPSSNIQCWSDPWLSPWPLCLLHPSWFRGFNAIHLLMTLTLISLAQPLTLAPESYPTPTNQAFIFMSNRYLIHNISKNKFLIIFPQSLISYQFPLS